jgi:amino acid transporter
MNVGEWFGAAKDLVIGRARNISDKRIFHKLSLIAFFAWVGLGADGLSSSCYGPPEAFLALTGYPYLSLLVGLGTVATVFIISASYSQTIELFPTGGGGYLVASKLLSPGLGVVSGSALLIDYVLTITLSIASGADALFSLLPESNQPYKLMVKVMGVCLLVLLNLRGVKEAVLPWVPIFAAFVLTHAFAIAYAIFTHLGVFPEIWQRTTANMEAAAHASQWGWIGMTLLVLRAYSLGAGTYTGIEAVSNGLPILREPRVQTGKRTMRYMAVSLAITVAGLFLGYLLYGVTAESGKTLNAVLFERLTASWSHGAAFAFIFATLISEAALLFVAAQTGFLDGPRVLANMATDRWMPTRFATLSDRLVTYNGILLMGGVSVLLMVSSGGSVDLLVVLYSINVFITFTLSQLGMVRHWWQERRHVPAWWRKITVNGVGCVLTTSILVMLSVIKFFEGGWVTLFVTGLLIFAAFRIKRHYKQTQIQLQRLDELVAAAALDEGEAGGAKRPAPVCNLDARTAVFFVNGFNGLGLHTLMAVIRMFPKVYQNFVFVQVGVLDAGNFKGAAEVENLRRHSQREVERYAAYLRRLGFYAEAHFALGTDVVEEATKLCEVIAHCFPRAQFFAGQLVFKDENLLTRWLHNHTVFELQRRLYQHGWPMLIVPIRV